MIRMSKETDYGIMLLTVFANLRTPLQMSARELAERTRVPLPMVSKILKTLAREGVLVSQRGARGGYLLARPLSRGDWSRAFHPVRRVRRVHWNRLTGGVRASLEANPPARNSRAGCWRRHRGGGPAIRWFASVHRA